MGPVYAGQEHGAIEHCHLRLQSGRLHNSHIYVHPGGRRHRNGPRLCHRYGSRFEDITLIDSVGCTIWQSWLLYACATMRDCAFEDSSCCSQQEASVNLAHRYVWEETLGVDWRHFS